MILFLTFDSNAQALESNFRNRCSVIIINTQKLDILIEMFHFYCNTKDAICLILYIFCLVNVIFPVFIY